MPQRFPGGSAVDLGGLDDVLRHALDPGDVYDHHVADLLPRHQDHQAPEAELRFQHKGGVEVDQDALEDGGPDVAQHDAADQVRHEEHGAEHVGALDAPGEGIGHREGEHVDHHKADQREYRGVPEGVPEALVGENVFIVGKARPLPVTGELEFCEGEEQAFDEGVQEPDAEGREGGQQEQREHPLDGTAHQL